jgi:hypothetical protein
MFDSLVGFVLLLSSLMLIGITRGRWVSQKLWVILWSSISIIFALSILLALLLGNPSLVSLVLGGSLAYVIAVTIHVLHHTIEEIRKDRK